MLENLKKPAMWLLILIIGLPQLSETIYTPSLPDIGVYLKTTAEMMEDTLSIYLFGFAIGTLLWGILSDTYGRRPCMLVGLFLYGIGSLMCSLSSSVDALLLARFFQALGGSVGSILGQAMCRDVFTGPERGKAYASIGAALSFAPAIGPIFGGIIDQYLGWAWNFYLLTFLGMLVLLISMIKLRETHPSLGKPQAQSMPGLIKALITDKHVLAFGFLVGTANGIVFSYYGEGSFYLIEMLGLSPSHYGYSFLIMASVGMCGAKYGKMLIHRGLEPFTIINRGLWICMLGSLTFALFALTHVMHVDKQFLSATLTILCMSAVLFSMGLMIPSTLSIALERYHYAVGRASSLFGFYYYLIVAGITYGMGELRDGSLTVMPVYFAVLSGMMLLLFRLRKTKSKLTPC